MELGARRKSVSVTESEAGPPVACGSLLGSGESLGPAPTRGEGLHKGEKPRIGRGAFSEAACPIRRVETKSFT